MSEQGGGGLDLAAARAGEPLALSRAVFEAIAKPLSGLDGELWPGTAESPVPGKVRIDERGVWVENTLAAGAAIEDENVSLWHPQIEVWELGLPSPDDVPSLPFPSRRHNGRRSWSQAADTAARVLRRLHEGLDDDALNKLGDRGVAAKAALKAAYEAYRIAKAGISRQGRPACDTMPSAS